MEVVGEVEVDRMVEASVEVETVPDKMAFVIDIGL